VNLSALLDKKQNPLRWTWDFREWGLRYGLLKAVPCRRVQGHPTLGNV